MGRSTAEPAEASSSGIPRRERRKSRQVLETWLDASTAELAEASSSGITSRERRESRQALETWLDASTAEPAKASSSGITRQERRESQEAAEELADALELKRLLDDPATPDNASTGHKQDVSKRVYRKLDNFSRLKRQGFFIAAEDYFHRYLGPLSNHVELAGHYADLFVEQGAYGRAQQFLSSQEAFLADCPADPSLPPPEIILRTKLQLIDAFSAMHMNGKLKEAYEKVRIVEELIRSLSEKMKSEDNIVSEVAQVIRYSLRILAHIKRETAFIPTEDFGFWADWAWLYKDLLEKQGVWHARDLFMASFDAIGVRNTLNPIFGEHEDPIDVVHKLVNDWEIVQYDDATYIAVFDLLVGLSNCLSVPCFGDDIMRIAQRCLRRAEGLVPGLEENILGVKRSRPYLRFVLLEEQLRRKLDPGKTDLHTKIKSSLGFTFWTDGPLPIYVPIKKENPAKYHPPRQADQAPEPEEGDQASESDVERIEAVLEIAHQAGDYSTEVLCLSELIYRRKGALRDHFARMHHVQVNLQGDILGHQDTLLSSFLFALTGPVRLELLAELRRAQGNKEGTRIFSFGDWCALKIENALCLSLGKEPPESLALLEASCSTYLPSFIQEYFTQTGLDEEFGLQLKSKSGEISGTRRVNKKAHHRCFVQGCTPC